MISPWHFMTHRFPRTRFAEILSIRSPDEIEAVLEWTEGIEERLTPYATHRSCRGVVPRCMSSANAGAWLRARGFTLNWGF